MAKDYAKIKALAASILECIGDEEEGKNPSLPPQTEDIDNGGQDKPFVFLDSPEAGDDEGEESQSEESAEGDDDKKNKKKKASLAMMSATLANKFGK